MEDFLAMTTRHYTDIPMSSIPGIGVSTLLKLVSNNYTTKSLFQLAHGCDSPFAFTKALAVKVPGAITIYISIRMYIEKYSLFTE